MAAVYTLDRPEGAVFGREERVETRHEDTLYDIARRYGLGSEELIRVNPGIDPWLPRADRNIVIPAQRMLPSGPRDGIVVNLPEHRLYFYPKVAKGQPQVVYTYPVSIGKMDWNTPLGKTRIADKREKPVWIPPESVRKEHIANGEPPLPAVVPAGPDNPLGDYAMRLGLKGSYLIHGTNNPLAVGMAVTHGCIRMYPEDIAGAVRPGAGGDTRVPGQRAGQGRPHRWRTPAGDPPAGGCPGTDVRAGPARSSRGCWKRPWGRPPWPSTGTWPGANWPRPGACPWS